jgi:hypothetical protein
MRSSDLHRYQGHLATTQHDKTTGSKEAVMAQPIDLHNFDRLLKDLKKFSPDTAKQFQRNLSKAVTPVRDQARNLVPAQSPITNWRSVDPTYTSRAWQSDDYHRGRDAAMRWNWRPTDVKRGIKISRTKTKTGRGNTLFAEQVTALAVINSSVGGIIYELAGTGKAKSVNRSKSVSRNPRARDSFINAIDRKDTGRGNMQKKGYRLLYRANALRGKRALDEIQNILDTQLIRFARSR